MLAAPSHSLKTFLGEYKLYGERGVLVSSESKTYEEIIPLKPSASRLPIQVIFAEVEGNHLYLVSKDSFFLYNLKCHQVECIFELPAKAVSAFKD